MKKTPAKKRGAAFYVIIAIAAIIATLVLWVGADVIIALAKKDAPRRPAESLNVDGVNDLIWVFRNPGLSHPDIEYTSDTITADIVLDNIADSVTYINNRYDCSDFRAIDLLKLYFVGGEALTSLSDEIEDTLRDTLTGFKFWITSQGKDSMCYHSENHEALFAAVEYLSGLAWPDAIFTIDGKTGLEHIQIARTRFITWMKLRFDYGFSEYLSGNYYPVDLAALAMLLQYGDHSDSELMTKAAITMDLLFYDYASHLYDGTFIGTSGRSYDYNNGGGYDSSSTYIIIDYVWQLGQVDHALAKGKHAYLVTDMLSSINPDTGEAYYEVPEVIINIGRDQDAKEVKASYGLDLAELAQEDILGLSDRQLMFLLGMGAKSNSEVIDTILMIMDEYNLWHNNFLSSLKYVNITIVRLLGLLPALMDAVNPSTNGSAIQRGNIYAYITDNYKMTNNQSYHPGFYGDQQTLSLATLPNGVTVYTTHPFRKECAKTPGYWAGFGVAPDAVQDKNVLLSIYKIPSKKIALAPAPTIQYTHTLFPEELMDEVVLDGNYAFGRVADTYIALIGASELSYLPYDQTQVDSLELNVSDNTKRFDLVQYGAEQFWIYELGSADEDGSFAAFCARIKSNSLTFNNLTLTYTTNGRTLQNIYDGAFTIDNTAINLDYRRFDSPYITADRKSSEFVFEFGGASLTLDFDNSVRAIN